MGSWNIGPYIVLTNKFCLLGEGFRPQIIDRIKVATKLPILVQRIYDEDLVGCLIAANSYGILLPIQTSDDELTQLKQFLEDSVAIKKLELTGTHNNAFGNIFLLNDKKAVIHSLIYEKNRSKIDIIEDILDVEVISFETDLTLALGSYVLVNSNGLVVSPLFNENEIEELRRIFLIPRERTIISTINMGNPILRSGATANDTSLLVGNRTSGVELARIYNILIG